MAAKSEKGKGVRSRDVRQKLKGRKMSVLTVEKGQSERELMAHIYIIYNIFCPF